MPKRRPIPKNLRLLLTAAAALLLLYVGSYLFLAARGNWHWSQTGKERYDFGLSISDVERWSPAWAHWEPFQDIYGTNTSRGNFPGYLYSPLIRLDRAFFHPDRNLFPTTQPTN